MELILLEPNSPEWDFMWNWLAQHPINKDIPEPTVALNGTEAWQYMGSFKQGERVIHELRHRNHPATNSVESLKLSASDTFTKEQINKSYRL